MDKVNFPIAATAGFFKISGVTASLISKYRSGTFQRGQSGRSQCLPQIVGQRADISAFPAVNFDSEKGFANP